MKVLFTGLQSHRLESLSPPVQEIRLPQLDNEQALRSALQCERPDLVIVFGSGLIFPRDIVEKHKIVNVHGSLLPWCKGPAPHLWSAIEGVPFGVTIHMMTVEIDGGPVIFQRPSDFRLEDHSLSSLFETVLSDAARAMGEVWPALVRGDYVTKDQVPGGSRHTFAMQAPFQDILAENLETPLPRLLQLIDERMGSEWRAKLRGYAG